MAIYMKIDSPAIKGESTDSKHKDWIELLSIDQSLDRPVAHRTGAGGQSTVQFNDINVTTRVGKHVPELAHAVANGTEFATIELDCCTDQGGGQRESYYKLKLEKVHVTHLNVSNSGEGRVGDVVNLGLYFKKIEWQFTKWEGPKNEGQTTKTWNVAENKP